MTTPTPGTNWRFIAGVSVLILAAILPLTAFLVPWLGLSTAQTALICGFLLAGAPEILSLVAVALLGRENFERIVAAAKNYLFLAFFSTPVSKRRYYGGLAIFLLSCLPLYLVGYAPAWMPSGNARIYLLACADLAFIFSFFVMGGEFWAKFRRLFVWEGKV
jgi:hypothetical protein